MQPGAKSRYFERARNVDDLGPLGDPERWGGDGNIAIVVPTGVASDQTRYSRQVIRAQCADLTARPWDVIVYWTIVGGTAGDVIDLFALEVSGGAGQATGIGQIVMVGAGIAPIASQWMRIATGGTLHLQQPIPAVAIAARLVLHVSAAGADPTHTVTASAIVNIAPRAI